jgi:hypothetical protein
LNCPTLRSSGGSAFLGFTTNGAYVIRIGKVAARSSEGVYRNS